MTIDTNIYNMGAVAINAEINAITVHGIRSMYLVGLLILMAAFAATIALMFVQRRLSRNRNPIIGLIIPTVHLLLSSAIWLAFTGGAPILQNFGWFLASNFPTALHLFIYFHVRKRLKRDMYLE